MLIFPENPLRPPGRKPGLDAMDAHRAAPLEGVLVACLAVSLAMGCRPDSAAPMAEDPDAKQPTTEPLVVEPVEPLRFLVIDDPDLAETCAREWQAETGRDVLVSNITEEAFDALTEPVQQDILVGPDRKLGDFVARGLAMKFPPMWLRGSGWAAQDLLPRIRNRVLKWSDDTRAVSLGSPMFIAAYRADLLGDRDPPGTWREYERYLQRLTKPAASTDAWSPALEPLAPGWAAPVFLARSASYVTDRSQVTALFEVSDMRPRIDSAPFVKALEDLVRAARLSGAERWLGTTPGDAARALANGTTGVAWTWPHPAWWNQTELPTNIPPVRFSELPGANEFFYFRSGRWESRDAKLVKHVSLIGIAGRIGVIPQDSQQQRQAFELLTWLAAKDRQASIATRSFATTMFRKSHLPSANAWLGPLASGTAGSQYVSLLEAMHNRSGCLIYPRFAHSKAYLELLDDRVRAAVTGRTDATTALRQVAEGWLERNEEFGSRSQRRSYLESQGLGALTLE